MSRYVISGCAIFLLLLYPIQYDTYGDFADNPARETYGVGAFGKTSHVTRNGEPASEA